MRLCVFIPCHRLYRTICGLGPASTQVGVLVGAKQIKKKKQPKIEYCEVLSSENGCVDSGRLYV